MTRWYIGHRIVTERREWLVEVVADSEEEARQKFDADLGNSYAYTSCEVVDRGPVFDVEEDMNDGMGR